MKVAIIGTGYVGLPTGVGLAEIGHDVVCIDREKSKIDLLLQGKVTLYEDGLEDLLVKNLNTKKLSFTTSMEKGIKDADVVLIAVGTPPHPVTHEADMQYVHAAATELAQHLTGYTVVATKSTVPVGTGDVLERLIKKTNPKADVDVVSLPEFLREGYAVYDFFNPDRIIVGANTQKAKDVISKLYENFKDKTNILFVGRRSSETIKYASNSFLAVKIHYINEMADFCEKVGANILEVAKGMGLDSRIGNKFLNPGPGFGGSCFPKDTMAMSFMAHQNNMKLSLVDATIDGNLKRKKEMALKIVESVGSTLKSRKISILGLAFKEGTDDCRQSPAIEIIEFLLPLIEGENIKICAYDPKAMDIAKTILLDRVDYASSIEECISDSDCLVILTEWPEFKKIDLDKVKLNMRQANIIDFRNLLNKDIVVGKGFKYKGVGV